MKLFKLLQVKYKMKINGLLAGFALFGIITGCNGQSKNLKDCKAHYQSAKRMSNDYYRNNNPAMLRSALNEVDKAIQCNETKSKSIELKISLLSLLKEFKVAYEFIDTLKDDNFKYRYKKAMNYNYFRALDYGNKLDTLNSNLFFKKSLKSVQDFIDKESATTTLNEEAYFDLFFIKKQFESKEKMANEIDSLKKKYPEHEQFFDALKGSLNGNVADANPNK